MLRSRLASTLPPSIRILTASIRPQSQLHPFAQTSISILSRESSFSTQSTNQQNTENQKEDFSKFGWKSIAAFVGSGVALLAYFQYERHVIEEERRKTAADNAAAGKPLVGGPFSLVDHNGNPVTDLDYRGKFVLLYFGYTFCPDVCPEELEKMAKVVDNIKKIDPSQSIIPLFVSCDPKRDSIASISEYVKDFHPDFIGLTGTHQQIKRVAKAYRLYFSAPPRAVDDDDADYLVDHSIFFYLINPEGKYVSHFGKQETAESVTEKIVTYLKGKKK